MPTYANVTDRPTLHLQRCHAQRMRDIIADAEPLGATLEYLLDACNLAATVDDQLTLEDWADMAFHLERYIERCRGLDSAPLTDDLRAVLGMIGMKADYAVGMAALGLK